MAIWTVLVAGDELLGHETYLARKRRQGLAVAATGARKEVQTKALERVKSGTDNGNAVPSSWTSTKNWVSNRPGVESKGRPFSPGSMLLEAPVEWLIGHTP